MAHAAILGMKRNMCAWQFLLLTIFLLHICSFTCSLYYQFTAQLYSKCRLYRCRVYITNMAPTPMCTISTLESILMHLLPQRKLSLQKVLWLIYFSCTPLRSQQYFSDQLRNHNNLIMRFQYILFATLVAGYLLFNLDVDSMYSILVISYLHRQWTGV